MLRISKIVDYGILVLTHMATRPAHVCSASELAGTLGLGQPVVSKVLKLLAQHAPEIDRVGDGTWLKDHRIPAEFWSRVE